jgi:hypothetical protein
MSAKEKEVPNAADIEVAAAAAAPVEDAKEEAAPAAEVEAPKEEAAAPAAAEETAAPKDWAKLRVAELKEECKSRGLDTKGKKADLVERLSSQ